MIGRSYLMRRAASTHGNAVAVGCPQLRTITHRFAAFVSHPAPRQSDL